MSSSNPYEGHVTSTFDTVAFTLSGIDGHSGALVRLLALMWEKEGVVDAQSISYARAAADQLDEHARAQGAVVITLEALTSFVATLKQPTEEPAEANRVRGIAEIAVGDIVVAGHGAPMKLEKIYCEDDDEKVRGYANCRLPRAVRHVTVKFEVLRRATPEEVAGYIEAGGTV